MKRQSRVIVSVGAASLAFLIPQVSQAACNDISGGVSGGAGCSTQGTTLQGKTLGTNIRTVTNILLFAVGIAAVIMIIIGGFRYVVSNGDPGNVKSAKDTIVFAVVGLVVAMLAYAIVNFVFRRI